MGTKPGRSARPDHVAEELARHQLGAISRAQALSAGLTERAVDWRVETGAWYPIYPGIYLVRGAPRTWEQQVLAACLAAGPEAVASHRTAAAVWDCPGSDPDRWRSARAAAVGW